MKKTTLLAAIAGLSFSGSVMADVFAFIEMPLTPSQEAVNAPTPTPAPASSGYGRITAFYDNVSKVLTYNVNWKLQENVVPITQQTGNNHLHGPADVGTSAAVVLALPDLPLTNSGNVSGSITLNAEQVAAIETDLIAGRMYYNIHSTLYSGGEIRGQLIPNGAEARSGVYQNSEITLLNVLVPGVVGAQTYDAVLNFINGTFVLTTATPVR
jgi:hypothetical protein